MTRHSFRPHPHLAALALLAWLACAQAEVTTTATPDAGAARSGANANWSAALEKSQSGATSGDLAKDLSLDSQLMREHLERDDNTGKIPKAKPVAGKTSPAPGQAASAAKVEVDRQEDWGSDFANAIRDVVKPLKQEISNSSVAQAVREIDLSLPKKPVDDGGPAPVQFNPVMIEPVGPVTSEEQKRRDRLAASQSMDQLIQDLKPWFYGLLGLLVVGYLAYVTWGFVQWQKKKAMRGRRSSTPNSTAAPLVPPPVARHSSRRSSGKSSRHGAL